MIKEGAGGRKGGCWAGNNWNRKRFVVDHGCDTGNDDTDNYDDDNIGGRDDNDDDNNDKDDNEVKGAANPTQPQARPASVGKWLNIASK